MICLMRSGCVAFRYELAGWFSSNSKHLHSSGMWKAWFQPRHTWEAYARSSSGRYWKMCSRSSWGSSDQSQSRDSPAPAASDSSLICVPTFLHASGGLSLGHGLLTSSPPFIRFILKETGNAFKIPESATRADAQILPTIYLFTFHLFFVYFLININLHSTYN